MKELFAKVNFESRTVPALLVPVFNWANLKTLFFEKKLKSQLFLFSALEMKTVKQTMENLVRINNSLTIVLTVYRHWLTHWFPCWPWRVWLLFHFWPPLTKIGIICTQLLLEVKTLPMIPTTERSAQGSCKETRKREKNPEYTEQMPEQTWC